MSEVSVPAQVAALQQRAASWAEQGRLRWLVGGAVAAALGEVAAAGKGPADGDRLLGRLEGLEQKALALVPPATAVPKGRAGSVADRRADPHPAAVQSVRVRRVAEADRYLVVFVGSRRVRKEWVSLAVGIDPQGNKHVLGPWPGASSDGEVGRRLLAEVAARGVDLHAGVLVVSEGAPALERLLRESLGAAVHLAHCQQQVAAQVLGHLPERRRAAVRSALKRAWSAPVEQGRAELTGLVAELAGEHPGASATLQASLAASLAVGELGLPRQLQDHLRVAGPVHVSLEEAIRHGRGARGGLAAVRRGLPPVVAAMRRLIGYQALPILAERLEQARS